MLPLSKPGFCSTKVIRICRQFASDMKRSGPYDRGKTKNNEGVKNPGSENQIRPSQLLEDFTDALQTRSSAARPRSTAFGSGRWDKTDLRLFTTAKDPVTVRHADQPKSPSKCPVFDGIEELELGMWCSTNPTNKFDEWLQWTCEGKIWNFPIDNEQDSEECTVPFHKHIFLDDYLDKDMLQCRPFAVFMELVCSGLANNPHISVEQKKEHLRWYASYFKDKLPAIETCVNEGQQTTQSEPDGIVSNK